jgi:hypothetical protein
MHFEFLRSGEPDDITVTVVDLKLGGITSTLQLQLMQRGKLKVLAVVTAINFDKPIGLSASTSWALHPAPGPFPVFDKVLAHQPEENWIPGRPGGELFKFGHNFLFLVPRGGFQVDGSCDAWHCFHGGEHMDATDMAVMTDIIPSMGDTLLRNHAIYDGHRIVGVLQQWAEKNPGIPAQMFYTMEDAMRSTAISFTVTLDIEFKRRLPKDGVRWVFTRTQSRIMENGRLDLEVTICDENMDMLLVSRQIILALDAVRKFASGKPKAAL